MGRSKLQIDRQSDECAVYNALIKDMYVDARTKLIAIIDHTAHDSLGPEKEKTLEHVARNLTGIQKQTLDDFVVQNQRSYALTCSFNFGIEYKLINREAMTRFFGEGNRWNEFYTKYPDSQGRMGLSRVGFNQERTQALVYVGNQRHFLVGAGYCVLLVKENGIWAIKDKVMIWIS